MTERDDVLEIAHAAQFKALSHPMRHRLLIALGGGAEATISQLAGDLRSNKGNIAHHLKVLVAAGLVRPAGTRTVRGGTERYYRRTVEHLAFEDAATTAIAMRALGAEIAAAEPGALLMLRSLRLSAEHVERLTATLQSLADEEDDGEDHPRYGLLLGIYQPQQADLGEPESTDGRAPPDSATRSSAS